MSTPEELATLNATDLMTKTKSQLVDILMQVHQENMALKTVQSFMDSTLIRLEYLERIQNISLQYERRNTVEISGIPQDIATNKLEDEVIRIYNEAEVNLEGKPLEKLDIQACHRKGKKGITICKFVNRKYAYEGLFNGKKLKNKKKL